MNKTFKNKKRIELDENYFLTPDGYNGLVLNFEEKRTKLNKEKESIEFVFSDKWYYPKLSMTLDKYLQLKAKECKSISDLKDIVLKVEKTIEQFN
jgi:hypothetical protein